MPMILLVVVGAINQSKYVPMMSLAVVGTLTNQILWVYTGLGRGGLHGGLCGGLCGSTMQRSTCGSTWRSMWVYTGLPGSTRVYVEVYMGLCGSKWVYIGLHGSTWVYAGLHGGLHGGLCGGLCTWVYTEV